MDTTNLLSIDFDAIARQFRLQEYQVRATVELLDEGNTVPFITRYRKDRTGGLDEEKIRVIEDAVTRRRQLNERKDRILRSIKTQNQLTPELEQRILGATSMKVLEDLYLPYRPKKQTLATVARQRGLEPLALEILATLSSPLRHAGEKPGGVTEDEPGETNSHAVSDPEQTGSATTDAAADAPVSTDAPSTIDPGDTDTAGQDAVPGQAVAADRTDVSHPSTPEVAAEAVGEVAAPAVLDEVALQARCEALINPELELHSVSDVLAGVRHILAEVFSERADIRALSRRLMWNGQLVSKRIERSEADDDDDDADDHYGLDDEYGSMRDDSDSDDNDSDAYDTDSEFTDSEDTDTDTDSEDTDSEDSDAYESHLDSAVDAIADAHVDELAAAETTPDGGLKSADTGDDSSDIPADVTAATAPSTDNSTDNPTNGTDSEGGATETAAEDSSDSAPQTTDEVAPAAVTESGVEAKRKQAMAVLAAKRAAAEERRKQRREARHRKRQKLEQSFKDYFNYAESLKKVPHYRILAVNRGERCKVLRVKVQFDQTQLRNEAERQLIPSGHPQAELVKESLHDSLSRLVVSSIDREIRRELTERAESHAVKVFAQNLRKLLLQAPLWGRRVLAIDPGFRSGCKLVALDEFGSVLGHTLIHVIGAAERVQQSRVRLVEQIRQYKIAVVAIGNGTACRETEQMVAGVLANELANEDVHYLIVNEAGASVYSTSQVGREELPRFDATVRGAVSIGRRVLDPLSELVKIDPASIGVGLYQHDVKAKHLRTSLDAVVESCVNFVGVDVNSASPALLGYVSGLNQLTARRLYEYRQQHGPFTNREQLRQVPGIGEATFVQAAGFLKISDSENPLDATWIHPESYETARRVLDEIGADVAGLSQWVRARRADRPVKPPEPKREKKSHKAESKGPATGEISLPNEEAPVSESPVSESPVSDLGEPLGAEPQPVSDGPPETEATVAADHAVVESLAVTPSGVDANASALETTGADEVSGEHVLVDQVIADPPIAEVAAAAESDDVTAETSSEDTAAQSHGNALLEKIKQADVTQLAQKLSVGELLLKDILASLARPGRDPREELSPPVFRREILKLEDLKAGMELSGTVLNVVDFGAFVDIGLSDSGLIHVSRLADRFVSDPHEVVSVGDILNVWVVDVDEKRRRVSLTAIRPGTETEKPQGPSEGERRGGGGAKRRKGGRRDKPAAEAAPAAQTPRGNRMRRPASGSFKPKPKPKPKPVVPITDAMADGKEPMRTFSDLQQFFQRKQDEHRDPKNKRGKK
jgi:uncharacterized protein